MAFAAVSDLVTEDIALPELEQELTSLQGTALKLLGHGNGNGDRLCGIGILEGGLRMHIVQIPHDHTGLIMGLRIDVQNAVILIVAYMDPDTPLPGIAGDAAGHQIVAILIRQNFLHTVIVNTSGGEGELVKDDLAIGIVGAGGHDIAGDIDDPELELASFQIAAVQGLGCTDFLGQVDLQLGRCVAVDERNAVNRHIIDLSNLAVGNLGL